MKRLLSVLLIFCFLLQGCETRDAQAERDAASRKRNRIEQTASAQPVTQAVSQSKNAVAQEVSADSASQDPKPQAAAVNPADTKPEEAQTADTPETETQVSANEAPEEETFDNSEAVSALRDGLSRLRRCSNGSWDRHHRCRYSSYHCPGLHSSALSSLRCRASRIHRSQC